MLLLSMRTWENLNFDVCIQGIGQAFGQAFLQGSLCCLCVCEEYEEEKHEGVSIYACQIQVSLMNEEAKNQRKPGGHKIERKIRWSVGDRPSRKMGGNDLRVCFRKDPNRKISEDSPGMIQIGVFDELMNKEAKKQDGSFSKRFLRDAGLGDQNIGANKVVSWH
jgi:hypothetical protein